MAYNEQEYRNWLRQAGQEATEKRKQLEQQYRDLGIPLESKPRVFYDEQGKKYFDHSKSSVRSIFSLGPNPEDHYSINDTALLSRIYKQIDDGTTEPSEAFFQQRRAYEQSYEDGTRFTRNSGTCTIEINSSSGGTVNVEIPKGICVDSYVYSHTHTNGLDPLMFACCGCGTHATTANGECPSGGDCELEGILLSPLWLSWMGDGECDPGAFKQLDDWVPSYNIPSYFLNNPVNFMCPEFAFDGGDLHSTKCDTDDTSNSRCDNCCIGCYYITSYMDCNSTCSNCTQLGNAVNCDFGIPCMCNDPNASGGWSSSYGDWDSHTCATVSGIKSNPEDCDNTSAWIARAWNTNDSHGLLSCQGKCSGNNFMYQAGVDGTGRKLGGLSVVSQELSIRATGGSNFTGTCFCDYLCGQYGDCCADFQEHCGGSDPAPPGVPCQCYEQVGSQSCTASNKTWNDIGNCTVAGPDQDWCDDECEEHCPDEQTGIDVKNCITLGMTNPYCAMLDYNNGNFQQIPSAATAESWPTPQAAMSYSSAVCEDYTGWGAIWDDADCKCVCAGGTVTLNDYAGANNASIACTNADACNQTTALCDKDWLTGLGITETQITAANGNVAVEDCRYPGTAGLYPTTGPSALQSDFTHGQPVAGCQGCLDPSAENYTGDLATHLGSTNVIPYDCSGNSTDVDDSCCKYGSGCKWQYAYNNGEACNTSSQPYSPSYYCQGVEAGQIGVCKNADYDCCTFDHLVCTDPDAENYVAAAGTDAGNGKVYTNCNPSVHCNFTNGTGCCTPCTYTSGCPDSTACNYEAGADGCEVDGVFTHGNMSCCTYQFGCTDADAENYVGAANLHLWCSDNTTCVYKHLTFKDDDNDGLPTSTTSWTLNGNLFGLNAPYGDISSTTFTFEPCGWWNPCGDALPQSGGVDCIVGPPIKGTCPDSVSRNSNPNQSCQCRDDSDCGENTWCSTSVECVESSDSGLKIGMCVDGNMRTDCTLHANLGGIMPDCYGVDAAGDPEGSCPNTCTDFVGNSCYDCCGICNGSNYFAPNTTPTINGECDIDQPNTDCAGTCGGTATYDCNGECGGDAVLDVCGSCTDIPQYFTIPASMGGIPCNACGTVTDVTGTSCEIGYLDNPSDEVGDTGYAMCTNQDGHCNCSGAVYDCSGTCGGTDQWVEVTLADCSNGTCVCCDAYDHSVQTACSSNIPDGYILTSSCDSFESTEAACECPTPNVVDVCSNCTDNPLFLQSQTNPLTGNSLNYYCEVGGNPGDVPGCYCDCDGNSYDCNDVCGGTYVNDHFGGCGYPFIAGSTFEQGANQIDQCGEVGGYSWDCMQEATIEVDILYGVSLGYPEGFMPGEQMNCKCAGCSWMFSPWYGYGPRLGITPLGNTYLPKWFLNPTDRSSIGIWDHHYYNMCTGSVAGPANENTGWCGTYWCGAYLEHLGLGNIPTEQACFDYENQPYAYGASQPWCCVDEYNIEVNQDAYDAGQLIGYWEDNNCCCSQSALFGYNLDEDENGYADCEFGYYTRYMFNYGSGWSSMQVQVTRSAEETAEGGEWGIGVGDLNQDGEWSVLDLVMLVNMVLGHEEQYGMEAANQLSYFGDVNGDGSPNILDIVCLVNCIVWGPDPSTDVWCRRCDFHDQWTEDDSTRNSGNNYSNIVKRYIQPKANAEEKSALIHILRVIKNAVHTDCSIPEKLVDQYPDIKSKNKKLQMTKCRINNYAMHEIVETLKDVVGEKKYKKILKDSKMNINPPVPYGAYEEMKNHSNYGVTTYDTRTTRQIKSWQFYLNAPQCIGSGVNPDTGQPFNPDTDIELGFPFNNANYQLTWSWIDSPQGQLLKLNCNLVGDDIGAVTIGDFNSFFTINWPGVRLQLDDQQIVTWGTAGNYVLEQIVPGEFRNLGLLPDATDGSTGSAWAGIGSEYFYYQNSHVCI